MASVVDPPASTLDEEQKSRIGQNLLKVLKVSERSWSRVDMSPSQHSHSTSASNMDNL